MGFDNYNIINWLYRVPQQRTLDLSKAEINALKLESSPDLNALQRALGYSIEYYKRLPADQRFQYGSVEYSPEEMIASHQHFLRILDLPAWKDSKNLSKIFCGSKV